MSIPVHIGKSSPEEWDAYESDKPKSAVARVARRQNPRRRPSVASGDIDWEELGFAPRWEGDDASECVVAFEPSDTPDFERTQLYRFIEGARQRGEIALVVSAIRDTNDGDVYNIFDSGGTEYIAAWDTQIESRPLGAGSTIRPAKGVSGADKDLALRLVNRSLTWRTLTLYGRQENTPYGVQEHPAAGHLESILVTALGEPVVAAWVAPDGVERRYLVPADIDWVVIAEWVRDVALPAMNMTAMQRYRPEANVPDTLRSKEELRVAAELADLEGEYLAARTLLETEHAEAEAQAAEIRELLLYSRGAELETGVAQVLRDAGVVFTRLDGVMGTQSADLLCKWQGRRRLIEVKSAGKAAGEELYGQLRKHLDAWAASGRESVEGGVLVVSHDLRSPATQRPPQVYSRLEFVRSLEHPVISAVELFDAWRVEDWDRIHDMFFPGASAEAPIRQRRWPWTRARTTT